MSNRNSENFKIISELELTTSGDTLQSVLNWYEREGGITLCDEVDCHTLISIVLNLVDLAESELNCYKLKLDYSISKPTQEHVSIFCARFLMDLYRVSDYEDLFDSLEKIFASLPSPDYRDDIGLSDLDEMSNYKKTFLLEAVSILQFHFARLKEEILATDLVPRDITKDLNLFSSRELIARIDKKLESLEFEECLLFLSGIKDALLNFLDLPDRAKDTLNEQMIVSIRCSQAQRYQFTAHGWRFEKTERDIQDIKSVVSWVIEKISLIEVRTRMQVYQIPMIRLEKYKDFEQILGCFRDLEDAGIIAHTDINELIKSRFYVGVDKPTEKPVLNRNNKQEPTPMSNGQIIKKDGSTTVTLKAQPQYNPKFIENVSKVKVEVSRNRQHSLKDFLPKNHYGSYLIKPRDIIRGLIIRISDVSSKDPKSPYYHSPKDLQIFISDLFSKFKKKGFSKVSVREIIREVKSENSSPL